MIHPRLSALCLTGLATLFAFGCPGRQTETAPTESQMTASSDSQSGEKDTQSQTPPEKEKVIERVFTDEQNEAAKLKAQELNIFFQLDDGGRVTVLDTAKNRSWVEEYQLPELLTLDYLTHLTLEGPGISDEAANAIAKLPRLTSLTMKNTLISNVGIEKLKAMETLRIIDLRLSPLVTDDAMKTLASMENLKAVRLNGVSQLTNTGLETILQLPSIVELDIRSCPSITIDGLKKLTNKSTLRMLKIGDQSVEDSTLEVIAKMTQLTGLAVQNSNITNAGLSSLSSLGLKDVTVEQCSAITDEGLTFLKEQSRLKKLTLRDLRIVGSFISELPEPTELASLNLAQTSVNDQAIKTLTRATNLQELNLSETPVSDDAIDALSKLSNLKKLYVMQTKMTDAGIEKLEGALPECEIRKN